MVGKRSRKDPMVALASPVADESGSELDIFTSPKTLSSILSSREISFSPIGSLDNEGDITFVIPSTPDEWTDFTQVWLSVSIIVETEDGKKIPKKGKTIKSKSKTSTGEEASEESTSSGGSAKIEHETDTGLEAPLISIPNDIFDCLFRRVMVEVNGTQVGSTHRFNPHVSVLQKMLTYSKSVGDSQLEHTIGWIVSYCPPLPQYSYIMMNYVCGLFVFSEMMDLRIETYCYKSDTNSSPEVVKRRLLDA